MWNFFRKKPVKNLTIQSLNLPAIVKTLKDPADNNQITEMLWDIYYERPGQTPFYADGSPWHNPVEDMFYRVNSLGIPGEDFVEGAPGLALGCSVTAGCGLWHKWTWPYILSQELGYPINVLGDPGRGITYCIDSLYKYINLYGKPEKVFLLCPDIFRVKVLELQILNRNNIDYNHHSFSWFTDVKDYATDLRVGPHSYRGLSGKKYSYPIELGIMQSVIELCRIESLCYNMGIDLAISSWDMLTNQVIELCVSDKVMCNDIHKTEVDMVKGDDYFREDEDLNRYMNTIHWFIDKIDQENCHSQHPVSKHNYWSIAADGNHPGIHAQLHYAERFLKKPISNKVLDIVYEPLPKVEVISNKSKKGIG